MPERQSVDLDHLRRINAIVRLQGREYVTLPGLLRIAHESGLTSIEPELISWDPADRAAVFKATVSGERGTYTAHGDANPGNVSKNIATATLRMAETRAISRALRSYLGIGMTAAEELPGSSTDEQDEEPLPPHREQPRREQAANSQPRREEQQAQPSEPAAPGEKHPSWTEAEAKRFCAALGHLQLRYQEVAAHCESIGRPRPSQMPPEQREGLYRWLRFQHGDEQVRKWAQEQQGAQQPQEGAA